MKFWNNNIKNLLPYTPGEQPKNNAQLIKLNTNENPYPPSPMVMDKLAKIKDVSLALYPESDWNTLRTLLSKHYSVPKENIFCGNGSDEILSLICRCFFSSESKVVIPYPNYSLYETLCQSNGIVYEYVQSNDDFVIDLKGLLDINSDGMFFSNPNAPTGIYYSVEQIYDFCLNYKGLFILDEAYIDFGGESGIELISKLDNIIIIRTFSKSFSLAGLRLGYAFGSKSLIAGLMKAKDSYNINYISQLLGCEAVKDYDYMLSNKNSIIFKRERLNNSLKDLGFKVIPSKANFIFVSHPNYPAKELYLKLKNNGILVRHFDLPRINNYIRITIGQKGQLDTLIANLKTILP